MIREDFFPILCVVAFLFALGAWYLHARDECLQMRCTATTMHPQFSRIGCFCMEKPR